MSLHADEGNGFPLTRLHHFPAVLRATNLQLPIAVILSSTIYTKLDAITLRGIFFSVVRTASRDLCLQA